MAALGSRLAALRCEGHPWRCLAHSHLAGLRLPRQPEPVPPILQILFNFLESLDGGFRRFLEAADVAFRLLILLLLRVLNPSLLPALRAESLLRILAV